jgi:hypothetical protein
LLLAADRALLETSLSRASAGSDEAAPAGSMPRPPLLEALRSRAVTALRARGVSRRRSLLANLGRLGLRGAAGVARDLAVDARPPGAASRSDYLIERGAAGLALDGRVEPFPSTAAATLAGVHELLDSLPVLTERRAWLQQARRRTDAEIVGRFGVHWLSSCAAAQQAEHDQLHRILVDLLGIAELRSRWLRPAG